MRRGTRKPTTRDMGNTMPSSAGDIPIIGLPVTKKKKPTITRTPKPKPMNQGITRRKKSGM